MRSLLVIMVIIMSLFMMFAGCDIYADESLIKEDDSVDEKYYPCSYSKDDYSILNGPYTDVFKDKYADKVDPFEIIGVCTRVYSSKNGKQTHRDEYRPAVIFANGAENVTGEHNKMFVKCTDCYKLFQLYK